MVLRLDRKAPFCEGLSGYFIQLMAGVRIWVCLNEVVSQEDLVQKRAGLLYRWSREGKLRRLTGNVQFCSI